MQTLKQKETLRKQKNLSSREKNLIPRITTIFKEEGWKVKNMIGETKTYEKGHKIKLKNVPRA